MFSLSRSRAAFWNIRYFPASTFGLSNSTPDQRPPRLARDVHARSKDILALDNSALYDTREKDYE